VVAKEKVRGWVVVMVVVMVGSSKEGKRQKWRRDGQEEKNGNGGRE
jgi:hypothetical protein